MIIKASQRGGANALAAHLMNGHDNEHVEVYAINGFLGSTVQDAFEEIDALSKATRCKQYLFSVSLSPPPDQKVTTTLFEKTVERIAKANSLEGQPHVIVFHEKQGRRHAHCVWSRIDTENMRAINLPFFKSKLMEIGKSIYLEQGWTLPNGHIDKTLRNPLNYSLAEWQQAKRQKRDPKAIKAELKALWSAKVSRQSFEQALNDRGYYLACGHPRRSFVIVDWMGQVRSLSRHTGAKTDELTERLGRADDLPAVSDIKKDLSTRLQQNWHQHMQQLYLHYQKQRRPLECQKTAMAVAHQKRREALRNKQAQALMQQRQSQQKQLSKGLRGMWQRLTGERLRMTRQHEQATLRRIQQDRQAMDNLIYSQLQKRRILQQSFEAEQRSFETQFNQFRQGVLNHGNTKALRQALSQQFTEQQKAIGRSLSL